jgi:imidazolonepropionase-like amidohydrolase
LTARRPTGTNKGVLAVRAGHAFDGDRFLPGGVTLLVEDGRITAVDGPAAPVPDGFQLLDLPRSTLLPGLLDTHVHLCADSGAAALDRLPEFDDDALDAVIATSLARHLATGVTAVRDLGDRRWAALAWRDRAGLAAAAFPRPAISASGPPLTSRRGHCWNMGGEVSGPAEIRAAIRDRAARAVDTVKVMASGGLMTAGTDVLGCQFTADELHLMVDAAHAAGLPITAHAHGLRAVQQAVAAGVDGIEHASCLTDHGLDLPDATLDALAAAGTAVCPTLGRDPTVSPPPRVLEIERQSGSTWEGRLALVDRMYRAGVVLVSGSDGGISPNKAHGLLPGAVLDLVDAGLPVDAALATATSTAARVCGFGTRKGRLAAGFDADLLLVDGDLRTAPAALHRVAVIVLAGRPV